MTLVLQYLVGQQEFDEGDDAEMPEGDYTVQVYHLLESYCSERLINASGPCD